MLDAYAEEVFLDLREYLGFDLVGFLAGEVFSSPTLILAMLRNLPEGSRYFKAMSAQIAEDDRPEPTAEQEEAADEAFWTPDRQLMAMLINAVREQTQVTGNWKKKPPEMPVIGPITWDKKRVQKHDIKKNGFRNEDWMRALGWNG